MRSILFIKCICSVVLISSVTAADEPKQDQKQAPAPQEKAPQVPSKEELE